MILGPSYESMAAGSEPWGSAWSPLQQRRFPQSQTDME